MKANFDHVKSLVWPFAGRSRSLEASELTMEQKDWLGARINDEEYTPAELSFRFKMSIRTLRTYALKLRSGVPNYEGKGGRPPTISKTASFQLAKKLRRTGYQFDDKEYDEALEQAQKDTAVEFKGDANNVVKISKYARLRIEKREGIQAGLAEVTTNARYENEQDIRNAVTFAAMNQLMSRVAAPQLIMNADGTVYTIFQGNNSKRVRFVGKLTGSRKAKPRKGEESLQLKYGVKFLCLVNAGGQMAAPVYIVADERLKKDEFHVQEIPACLSTWGVEKAILCFAIQEPATPRFTVGLSRLF